MLDPSANTRHVYAGVSTIEEYVRNDAADPNLPAAGRDPNSQWVLVREVIWGDRFPEPLALVDSSAAGDNPTVGVAETVYLLHDALGSVVGVIDAAGDLVERIGYDPYGRMVFERWDPGDPRPRPVHLNASTPNAGVSIGESYFSRIRASSRSMSRRTAAYAGSSYTLRNSSGSTCRSNSSHACRGA